MNSFPYSSFKLTFKFKFKIRQDLVVLFSVRSSVWKRNGIRMRFDGQIRLSESDVSAIKCIALCRVTSLSVEEVVVLENRCQSFVLRWVSMLSPGINSRDSYSMPFIEYTCATVTPLSQVSVPAFAWEKTYWFNETWEWEKDEKINEK